MCQACWRILYICLRFYIFHFQQKLDKNLDYNLTVEQAKTTRLKITELIKNIWLYGMDKKETWLNWVDKKETWLNWVDKKETWLNCLNKNETWLNWVNKKETSLN